MDDLTLNEQFILLIEQHKGILYKISRSYSQESEDRKDLIQEMIIQLWNSFSNYDSKMKWSTWMYRIALNVAISHYRRESRRRSAFSQLPDDILDMDDQEMRAEMNEKIALLHAFIGQLNKIDKALMILYLDDLSYQDISEILGITKTNVATKISRIKIRLKKYFLNFTTS